MFRLFFAAFVAVFLYLPLANAQSPQCIPQQAAEAFHKKNNHVLAARLVSERGYLIKIWLDARNQFYLTAQMPGQDVCMLDKGPSAEIMELSLGNGA